jgi:branched-chain amino acid transport system substrate-binding protein
MTRLPTLLFLVLLALLPLPTRGQAIKLVIDAEFGIPGSTSAQAIHAGAQVAVSEINAAGGVLGRPLEIVTKDNRGVPARALNHLREAAADPAVVAVMCGKYSPVAIDLLPEIHRLQMPYLDPWAAADPITDNGYSPNFVFRLSLRDNWALQAMLRQASKARAKRVALLLPNSDWGRSSLRAAERAAVDAKLQIVGIEWFNFGDQSLLLQYRNLLATGAQALLLVANEQEGAMLVKELAALPAAQRLSVIAHWGITGGRFFDTTQAALREVDVSVVQTFTFLGKSDPATTRLLAGLRPIIGHGEARKVASPAGVAHAYDLVHLLARAIGRAGSTERPAIRAALEQLGPYRGVTRHFARPFTPARHDALGPEDVFMARFAADGAIEPLPAGKP